MQLAPRIAELSPRRQRRAQLLALLAFPVTALMTVLVVILSSVSIYWAHSPAEVALSVGLALTAAIFCGIAGINARQARRACRSEPTASSATTTLP